MADPAYLVEDTVEYPVQVNGKVRGRITVAADADADAVEAAALADEKVVGVPGGRDAEEGHRGGGPAGQRRRLANSARSVVVSVTAHAENAQKEPSTVLDTSVCRWSTNTCDDTTGS